MALVAHQGSLIRVGGMRATNEQGEDANLVSVAEVARFDIASKTWQPLPDLPEPRSSHDAAVVGNTLYVISGWRLDGDMDDGDWQTKGLALDLSQSSATWEAFDLPFERRALAVAVAGERLVIVGGMGSGHRRGQHRICQRHGRHRANPGLGDSAWKPRTKLVFPRYFHRRAHASDTALLAVGGIWA